MIQPQNNVISHHIIREEKVAMTNTKEDYNNFSLQKQVNHYAENNTGHYSSHRLYSNSNQNINTIVCTIQIHTHIRKYNLEKLKKI